MNILKIQKKSVQEWNFSLFQLQWFTAVEDVVILGLNSSSQFLFYVFPLLLIFLLSLSEEPCSSMFSNKDEC